MYRILSEEAIRVIKEEEEAWMIEGNPIIVFCNHLSLSEKFGNFVLFVIILNTAVLSLQWPGIDEGLVEKLNLINLVFTIFFSAEMVVKLIGLG